MDLLRNKPLSLDDEVLETAALDILWRFKLSSSRSSSFAPFRYAKAPHAIPHRSRLRATDTSACRSDVRPPQHITNGPPEHCLQSAASRTISCAPTTVPRPPSDLRPTPYHVDAFSPTVENFEERWKDMVDWLTNDDGGSSTTADSLSVKSVLHAPSRKTSEIKQDASDLRAIRGVKQPDNVIGCCDQDQDQDQEIKICLETSSSYQNATTASSVLQCSDSLLPQTRPPVSGPCEPGNRSSPLTCAHEDWLLKARTSPDRNTVPHDRIQQMQQPFYINTTLGFLQQWLYQALHQEHDASTKPQAPSSASTPCLLNEIGNIDVQDPGFAVRRRKPLTTQEAKRREDSVRERNERQSSIFGGSDL